MSKHMDRQIEHLAAGGWTVIEFGFFERVSAFVGRRAPVGRMVSGPAARPVVDSRSRGRSR